MGQRPCDRVSQVRFLAGHLLSAASLCGDSRRDPSEAIREALGLGAPHQLLATMLSSGVQLLEALDVSKRVMNNRVLEQAVEDARQNIREGETIAEPLKRSGQFPPLVTHMIAVGEKSGEMEEMLRRIGQIYDGEVDRVITRFTSLLEPIMIVVMGVIVLFIVVAILLPIFEMGQMVR